MFMQFGKNALMITMQWNSTKIMCSKSKNLIQGHWKWLGMKIMHLFKNSNFPPKFRMKSLEKWTFDMMIFGEM
jgi:hypothetical protein